MRRGRGGQAVRIYCLRAAEVTGGNLFVGMLEPPFEPKVPALLK